MPLRNVKGKWYWGSKGPFDTKAKALAVSRAAYAHGYKVEKKILSLIWCWNSKKKFQRKIRPSFFFPKTSGGRGQKITAFSCRSV